MFIFFLPSDDLVFVYMFTSHKNSNLNRGISRKNGYESKEKIPLRGGFDIKLKSFQTKG